MDGPEIMNTNRMMPGNGGNGNQFNDWSSPSGQSGGQYVGPPRYNGHELRGRKKIPFFTLSMGWGSLFWIIIIAIIIIVVFWIFTGGKPRQFIGIPDFTTHKPSEILDPDTMNILNIHDPLTPRSERNSSRESVPDSSRIDSNNRNEVNSNLARGNNVIYNNRFASSQPASIILPSGRVESRTHMTPRLSLDDFRRETSIESGVDNESSNSPSQSDGNDQMEVGTSHRGVNDSKRTRNNSKRTRNDSKRARNDNKKTRNDHTEIKVNHPESGTVNRKGAEGNEEEDHPVQIYIPSPRRPTPGHTPRFEDLDIGTSEERRTNAESRGERICREYFQQYYGKSFARCRPDFLVNPLSGRNLELDGYCPELAMGFEYHGYQHYRYPNHFHRSREQFEQQLRRDNYKREACERAGVYLITIDYNVPHTRIPDFIKGLLPHNYQPPTIMKSE